MNIEKVGVEKYFYGTPAESDLDERITSLENEYAPLVDALRAAPGPPLALSEPRIPCLVAHLVLRTRQLRQWMAETVDSMLERFLSFFNDEDTIRRMVARELGRGGRLRDTAISQLEQNGVRIDNVDAVMAHIEPSLHEFVAKLIPDLMPKIRTQIDEIARQRRVLIPDTLRAGHLASMSHDLSAERRSAAYAQYNWFVIESASPVILGDTVCVFEADGERRFKPLNDGGEVVRRIYLPLGTDRILVGTPFKSQPTIDTRKLNKAIARCAYEFFVSPHALPADSPLSRGLGKWSGLLSDDEVRSLVDQAKREFFQA